MLNVWIFRFSNCVKNKYGPSEGLEEGLYVKMLSALKQMLDEW